jgi:hypothetical protein
MNNIEKNEITYNTSQDSRILYLIAEYNGKKELVKCLYKGGVGSYNIDKPLITNLNILLDKEYNKNNNEFTEFIVKYDTLDKYLKYKTDLENEYNNLLDKYNNEVLNFKLKNNLNCM